MAYKPKFVFDEEYNHTPATALRRERLKYGVDSITVPFPPFMLGMGGGFALGIIVCSIIGYYMTKAKED